MDFLTFIQEKKRYFMDFSAIKYYITSIMDNQLR